MPHDLAEIALQPLRRADGSASYACGSYSVIAAVNGPVEVQRRDELPEEAALEINVRSATGLGGVRERHLESIILKTLRQIIIVSAFPRTLIQISLQILASSSSGSSATRIPQADSELALLPALFEAALLALLSTTIPLKETISSTSVDISSTGAAITSNVNKSIANRSRHVFAFSSRGSLLLSQSEGCYTVDEWMRALERAMKSCLSVPVAQMGHKDVPLGTETDPSQQDVVRAVLEERIANQQHWRRGLN